LVPRAYVPFKSDGTLAANLLSNGSLDDVTGSSPTQTPVGWVLVGTPGSNEKFAGGSSDPYPPVISDGSPGRYWEVQTGPAPGTSLEQTYGTAIGNGKWVSIGAWVRSHVVAGSAVTPPNDSSSLKIDFTGGNPADDILVRFPQPSSDWSFIRTERRLTTPSVTAAVVKLLYAGSPDTTFRFDDVMLFEGRYRMVTGQKQRLIVRPSLKPRKASGGNLIAGVGGFERDSDNDGLPDGWVVTTTGTHDAGFDGSYVRAGVTYSLQIDPDLIRTGRAALNVVTSSVLANTGFATVVRGRFLSGEVWEFSAWIRIGPSFSSSPLIQLLSEQFNDTGVAEQVAQTSVPTSNSGTYTRYSVQLALTGDCDALECRIWLAGITSGGMQIDDCSLTKVA
jgi:hypothetical protein